MACSTMTRGRPTPCSVSSAPASSLDSGCSWISGASCEVNAWRFHNPYRRPKSQILAIKDVSEPRQSRFENAFHERVIVDATLHNTAQRQYLPVALRDGQGLARMSFFHHWKSFPRGLALRPHASALHAVDHNVFIVFNQLGDSAEVPAVRLA